MKKHLTRKDKHYRHLKTKNYCPLKMDRKSLFGGFCVIFILFGTFSDIHILSAVEASIVSVDSNGAYNKLTVKITDKVPRQLCQQTLDTLEVRS